MKIRYIGQSRDYSHPADRRRLVYWARCRGFTLTQDHTSDVQLTVLSGRANFPKELRYRKNSRIVLDLIDGYLSKTPFVEDFLRGIGKVGSLQISSLPKKYSTILKMACERVDAVICETEEQAEVLRIYNPKVFPILDFHEEFPFIRGDRSGKERIPKIFWEGLPFTSPGLQICVEALKKAKVNHGAKLEMVTDLTYPKFLGRYFESSTLKLNNPVHSALGSNFSIKSWSIDQVVKSASQSNMAILPIDEKSNLARLKAENRLLIMWRLGLPTLVSPTLAYRRVMERAGIDGICNDSWEWQQKIECLLEDKDVRSANISKGQHYLNTHHNKEILMSKWDYFLEETL